MSNRWYRSKWHREQNATSKLAKTDTVENLKFALKPIRTIPHINQMYGAACEPKNQSENVIHITNSGALALYDKDRERLFYDSVEITNFVKNRLGRTEDGSDYETISNYTWVVNENGYIAYKADK